MDAVTNPATTPDAATPDAPRPAARIAPGLAISSALFAVALIGTYWTPLVSLVGRWWSDDDYVYGFLVPIFAGVILWVRRDMVASLTPRSSLWGLALIALGGWMRWVSAYYYFALVDPLSLVPMLAGIVLFVAGWRALRWAAPAIAFLTFMVPLPGMAAGLMGHPLQRIGTLVSTYALQTMGFWAVAHGNVIQLSETQLGVVEACSGLRMMMLFFAVCFAAAFLVKRPLLDRVVILLSAAPIAVLANVARIVATGMLHELVSAQAGDTLFHDLAAWFMMPLAVVVLWVEMGLLDRLLVKPELPGRLALSPVPVAGTARNRARNRSARGKG